jgi:hypothetical protein
MGQLDGFKLYSPTTGASSFCLSLMEPTVTVDSAAV